jgi:hypothetical protein
MRISLSILIGLGIAHEVNAQSNLVPNPSFEEFEGCPYNSGAIWRAEPWVSVRGSVDYYHECGINGWGVPISWGGGIYARTGQAYIGLAACASPIAATNPLFSNAQEFAGVGLISPLQAGLNYRVEFFASLIDVSCYAIKNIGVHLSIDQPPPDIGYLINLSPQVKYEGKDFLADKEDWIRIEGMFTAQGGESFITIGNFNDDDSTDTLAVSCIDSGHAYAAYFIDDVSVIPVDSLVGLGGQLSMGNEQLSIHPNPASEYLIIESESSIGTLRMMDMAGREVLSVALHSQRQSIDVAGIPAGVYVAVLEENRAVLARRIVVIR